jgi:hypothetical protein
MACLSFGLRGDGVGAFELTRTEQPVCAPTPGGRNGIVILRAASCR